MVERAGLPRGTPDGKVAPVSMRSPEKGQRYLTKARAYAKPDQAKVIGDSFVIPDGRVQRLGSSVGQRRVLNNSHRRFINGLHRGISRRRARQGQFQRFVSITVRKRSRHPEDSSQRRSNSKTKRLRGLLSTKKQGVTPPIAKAIETIVETGISMSRRLSANNLPNERRDPRKRSARKAFL